MDEEKRKEIVRKFIYHFRKASQKICRQYQCRGIAGLQFSEELTNDIELSFHLNHNSVYLRCDGITFLERPYNERDMKGEDHRNINVISLYTKLEMMLRDGKINEIDFEKLLFRLV